MKSWLLVPLLIAGCVASAPAPRYERVPVPSTPFTIPKLELDAAICVEKGKTLRCVATPRTTQDCWCEPR